MSKSHNKSFFKTIIVICLILILALFTYSMRNKCFAESTKYLQHGSFNSAYLRNNSTINDHKGALTASESSGKGDVDATPTAFTTNNWMGTLPDNALLTNINIPGTHDSGTKNVNGYSIPSIYERAQCQQWYINEQLENGIRYFDIRSDEKGLINHGGFECLLSDSGSDSLYFGHVVKWIVEFLKKNPSETVLLDISRENHKSSIAPKINADLESYAGGFVFDSAGKDFCSLRLIDTRGKIVLLSNSNSDIDKVYKYNSSGKDFADLSSSKISLGYIQNEYSPDSPQYKFETVKNFYKKDPIKSEPANANSLLLDYTTFWIFRFGRGIKSLRDELMDKCGLTFYLRSNRFKKLGILAFDYPEPGLIRQICLANKSRENLDK